MFCNITTFSGKACAHPGDACPIHTQLPDAAPAPPAEDLEPKVTRTFKDPRLLGQIVVERVLDESASPIQAARLIRTLRALHSMGNTPEDEDAVLAEIELRGVVMNGFPPRNEEEWDLARKVFDADAITEFHRWEAEGRGW